ncbi:MAG: hypothetical protein ACP5H3_03190, partial [Candidatus Aenigmatarchaeota archaeon]
MAERPCGFESRPGRKEKSSASIVFKNTDYSSLYMEEWKKDFERKLEKLENANFNSENKKIVIEYIKFKQSQNLSYHRLIRVLDFLWHLLENFDFEFSQLNQEKVEKILIWLNQEDWKDWTKYSYGRILKNFLSWLNEKYNLKLNLKNVKVQKPKNSLMPEYLITEEEFNKLFNATDDLQTRLIIGLLYESS